ncbi:MAG: hypothetical protein KJO69_06555, partial [Gammaproteobacteria bacterium]|nr:hypothetical protein [Gammaproteobacteria bacterium]
WPGTAYASQTATTTQPFVINPRPDSETGASPVSRYRWAHPQMDYEVPVMVRGGAFPYFMEIDTDNTSAALTGITIGQTLNSGNEYTVTIPQSTINGLSTATDYDIYVKVTDQTGKQMKVWWSFQKEAVELDHFFFVDNSYTGGTADGKFSTPFKSFDIANWLYESTSSSSAGKTLVIKEGNSQSGGSEYTKNASNGSWNMQSTDLPISIINIPGETPVVNLQNTYPLFGLAGGANEPNDVFVRGIKCINGRGTNGTEGYGAFVNGFEGDHKRIAISKMILDTTDAWVNSATTNNGCITISGAGSAREHVGVVDIEFLNIPGSGATNAGGATMLMGCKWGLFDRYNVHDYGAGSGTEHIIHAKKSTRDTTFRRVTAKVNMHWVVNTYGIKLNEDPSTQGYLFEDTEICYIDMEAPDADNLRYVGMVVSVGSQANGPVYVYRTTCKYGGTFIRFTCPVELDDNVHTDANNNVGATGLTVVTDYDNTPTDYQTGTTLLTDAYLTTQTLDRGEIGHEIA